MAEAVRCHACGANHDVNDLFCPRCGAASSTAATLPSGESPAPKTAPTDELLRELQEALAPQLLVIKELGAGGMGTVYLARDPALKRLAAIKVLHPEFAHDESARKRFEREAESAAAVAHPNVVSIYQVGVLPRSNSSYFVMQFIEGETLAEAFPVGKPAPVLQARRIIGEVASALAAAHGRGLVHRDIKPANIMVEQETGRTVVLDFGISAVLQTRQRPSGPKLTATGSPIGTPTYMSPEQAAADEVTPATDVYSLGCVAFELLTGRPPFIERSPLALAAAHIKEAPPAVGSLRPDVDPVFGLLVDRCLAKKPANRPESAALERTLLPERTTLDWPPPGLDSLRGTGGRWVRSLYGPALLIAIFALLTNLAPSETYLSTGPGQSQLAFQWNWLTSRTGSASPAWFLAIAALGVAGLLAAVWHVVLTAVLSRRLLAALGLGYPASVVIEVASDLSPDLGSLVAGTRVYASLSARRRRRLRGLRIAARTVELAGLVLAALLPILWVVGVLRTGDILGPLTSTAEVEIALAVPLTFLLTALLLRMPEARYRLVMAGESIADPRRRGPKLSRTVVDAWLAEFNEAVARFYRPLRLALVPIVLAAAGVVGWGLVALVSALYGVTSIASARLAADQDSSYYWVRQFYDQMKLGIFVPDSWLRIDSVLGRISIQPSQSLDSLPTALSAVANWSGRPEHGYRPIEGLPTALSQLSPSYRLPTSALAKLQANSADPDVITLLQVGRLGPLPRSWRKTVPGPRWEEPSHPFDGAVRFRDVAWRAHEVVLLELVSGRPRDAEVTARSMIGAGRQLLRSTSGPDAGAGFLLSALGRDALEGTGVATRRTGLVVEAERVRSALLGLHSSLEVASPRVRRPLWVSTETPVGLGAVADTSVLPSTRFFIAAGVVDGFCLNSRELLWGPSKPRRALVDSVAVALRDLPGSASFTRQLTTALDSIAAGAMADPGTGRGASMRRWMSALGLRRLAARIGFCTRQSGTTGASSN